MNTVTFIEDSEIEDYRTDFRPKNRGSHFENRGLPCPILTNKNRGLDNNWLMKKIKNPWKGGAHSRGALIKLSASLRGRSFEGGAHSRGALIRGNTV